MNGICQLYEQRLKQLNPGIVCVKLNILFFLATSVPVTDKVVCTLNRLIAGVRNITYDITELYAFIDNLGDLCCLVYNGSGAYEPHNKQVRC